MISCPKCNQILPDDFSFREHAIAAHGAPADIRNESPQIMLSRPAGAQMVTPVTPAFFDNEGEHYTPSNPTPRPRTPLPDVQEEIKAVLEEKNDPPEEEVHLTAEPLQLIYHYEGQCPKCYCEVTTTIIKVEKESFAIGLCPICHEVKAKRKVKPL